MNDAIEDKATRIDPKEGPKKERRKVSLKLNENYLNIPSVSTTERISKLKRRM